MPAPDPATAQPTISVIVPARDKEASRGACLESLVAQTGVSFEIIVVDDGSTDRTREIAQSFSEVRVVDAGPLPQGWTGKNNTRPADAKQARGEWLLFTDADTLHSLTSLARGLTEAELCQAQLLSYSPEQEVRGFWEKAVMPVIFAGLAATYPSAKVNDPASSVAAANGQYLLISREAYDAVGGNAKIANDLLEDVAMARLVKFSGRKIFFRYGGDAVRTRMYRSFAQMKEGWTKNLALLFKHPLALALLRLAEFALILANLVTAILASLSGRSTLAFQTTLLTIILAGWFWIRIRKAHFPRGSNIIALLGLPVFSYLLFNSARLSGKNRVTWKGRSYGRNTEKCDSIRQNHASKSNESTLDIAATAHRRTSSEARLALSDPQS